MKKVYNAPDIDILGLEPDESIALNVSPESGNEDQWSEWV